MSSPQATFLEYGFCETLDALKNVDEAQKKLVSIEPRLDQIERMLADPEADLSLVIVELRDVVAHLNGILQVGGCNVYGYNYSNVCTVYE